MKDEDTQTEENKSTFVPMILAAGVAVFLLGVVIYVPLIVVGLLIVGAGLFKLFKDGA
jgi:hypothetical protein